MAVPKRRQTSTRRDKRRSHMALKAAILVSCSNCGEQIPSHTICPHCGHYKGDVVLKGAQKAQAEE